MKKIILGLLLFSFVSAGAVYAIDLGGGLTRKAASQAGYSGTTSETTFSEILGKVVQAALSFVGVIFLSLTIYGGFLWMLARGEEAKIDKAKDIVKGAVIGLVITVGAYSITAFVVPKILAGTQGKKEVGAPGSYFCCLITNTTSGVEKGEVDQSQEACAARCQDDPAIRCNPIGPMTQDVASERALNKCQ